MDHTTQTVASLVALDVSAQNPAELPALKEALAERIETERERRAEIREKLDDLDAAFAEGRVALRAGTADAADLRSLSDDIDLYQGVEADIERDLAQLTAKLAEVEAERARNGELDRMAAAAKEAKQKRTETLDRFEEVRSLLKTNALAFLEASDAWRAACETFRDAGLAVGLPAPDDWTVTETRTNSETGLVSTTAVARPEVVETMDAVRMLLEEQGVDAAEALAAAKAGHRLGNRPGSITHQLRHESLWGPIGRGADLPTGGDRVRELLLLAIIAITGGSSQPPANASIPPSPPPSSHDDRIQDDGTVKW